MLIVSLAAHLLNITFSAKSPAMQTDTVKARFSIKNHASPAANKRRHEAFFNFILLYNHV